MKTLLRTISRNVFGLSLLLTLCVSQPTLGQWKMVTGVDLVLGKDVAGGKFIFHSRTNENSDFLQITFDDAKGNWSWREGLVLQRGGNVGIGITTPDQKLTVAGTIKAKDLIVYPEDWPDYVFEDTYDLPPLDEVAAYLLRNKHLPGIPAARDVEANGIVVGEMNARLLQKVEELTLYLLELKRDQDALHAENEHLRARVADLEAQQ